MFLLEADDPTIPAFKDVVGRDRRLDRRRRAATGCGTATCTRTTSAPRSKRASRRAGRRRSASPTSSSRSRKSSGSARPRPPTASGTTLGTARRCTTTRSSRSRSATGSSGSCAASASHAVVAGGQSMNPSTAQILDAVERTPSKSVIVLPNNKNIVPVAQPGRRADRARRRGRARPTRSSQALAALVSYDPDAALDANVSDDVRGGGAGASPARSPRPCAASTAECGPIAEGDWIAVTRRRHPGGRARRPSRRRDLAVRRQLIDADDEIVTVLVGARRAPG